MINEADRKRIVECAPYYKDTIRDMQIAVFVMCGGGFLGRFAAEHPAQFYIDDRVRDLPYSRNAIEYAVEVLAIIAEANGLDAKNIPSMPRFHNMGIF